MRICMYTETALPTLGGQEMVIDALAREFLARGHEPVVLAPPPRRMKMADEEFPYAVVRHPRFLSTRHFMDWHKQWLLRAQRQLSFDILHCHSIYPCGYLAALCAGRLSVPTVITSHGGDVHMEGRRLSKPGLPLRYAQSIANADALISISKFTHEGYLRLLPGARNIVSIPNGVDLAPFRQKVARPADLDPSIHAGDYFLFIGRLHRRKGVDVLLDALAQVSPRSSSKLVLAGDGDERVALESQAARLGLKDRVKFLGSTRGSAKIWLLQNARFVVTPSRTWEAFGLVVLEAYAAGRGVIATTLPGMMDLVEPERTGLLVPPESPTHLAKAIATLHNEPHLADHFGQQAQEYAQNFGWRVIADRHLALYQHLAAAPALRRAA